MKQGSVIDRLKRASDEGDVRNLWVDDIQRVLALIDAAQVQHEAYGAHEGLVKALNDVGKQ